jgi:predicted nucleic acid-binding Zn ribbon protein
MRAERDYEVNDAPAGSSPHSAPEARSEAERSAVVASPQAVCAVCGGARASRKREACSDRCRAALSRQRQAEARARWVEEVLGLLLEALRRLGP